MSRALQNRASAVLCPATPSPALSLRSIRPVQGRWKRGS